MSYNALHLPTGRVVEVTHWCPNYARIIDQGIEGVVDPADLGRLGNAPEAFEAVGYLVVDLDEVEPEVKQVDAPGHELDGLTWSIDE
jgi:hypothetical protein